MRPWLVGLGDHPVYLTLNKLSYLSYLTRWEEQKKWWSETLQGSACGRAEKRMHCAWSTL